MTRILPIYVPVRHNEQNWEHVLLFFFAFSFCKEKQKKCSFLLGKKHPGDHTFSSLLQSFRVLMKKVHYKDTLCFCKTHSSNRHSAILSNAAHKILFISRHVVWLHTSLPITVTIYLHFSHPLSFTSSPPLVFSSSGLGGWLRLFFFCRSISWWEGGSRVPPEPFFPLTILCSH